MADAGLRHRHLLNDLAAMMPHGKKDSKFDSKSKLYQLNELAELYNCNNVLFFEARKGKDLYMWMSKVPNGPTVKFYVQNRKCLIVGKKKNSCRSLSNNIWKVHTMEELHFTGNCLRGSRPILSFDSAFDKEPHLQLIREIFTHIFGVPQGARKSKPFIDRVMGFSIADGKIWVRNYEIREVDAAKKEGDEATQEAMHARGSHSSDKKDTDISLVEIGGRFVLTPIVIQEGSFGGPLIYENKQFVSPNFIRAEARKAKAMRHNARAEQIVERRAKRGELGLTSDKRPELDELDSRALFA